MGTVFETRSVSISDIALALNTTKTTVSYALNGKGRMAPATREKILQTAQQMGFQPNPHAQRLTKGRCDDVIALFILNFDLGVTTRKLQLLQREVTSRGFHCPIHVCGTQEKSDVQGQSYQTVAMRSLRFQKPLGIICNVAHMEPAAQLSPETLHELEMYKREGGFVVCYDVESEIDCDQVIFDREENTYSATRFLLKKGHRDIAFYGGWKHPHPQRLAGFKQALQDFGVPFQDKWILRGKDTGAPYDDHCGFNEDIGRRLVAPFLALAPRPSAICLADDIIAAAFIAEIQRQGIRVPQDVSVIGHDDLPLASTISAVPLSTVSQPLDEISETIIEMMMERIQGVWQGEARKRILYGKLVERNSVATK